MGRKAHRAGRKKCVCSPIVQQNIGAFDVTVQEIVLVAKVQSQKKLPHERRNVLFAERHQTGLQQSHQVMVHVLEHQVKCPWNVKQRQRIQHSMQAIYLIETDVY